MLESIARMLVVCKYLQSESGQSKPRGNQPQPQRNGQTLVETRDTCWQEDCLFIKQSSLGNSYALHRQQSTMWRESTHQAKVEAQPRCKDCWDRTEDPFWV